ncbi:SPOR domain-containing protein [Rossellomorea aquimaris]|uniref:SPOR domain-containing protein n=1 Tax=Rossellomorea aquimaris TaxID=189382 RepID=A0A5D4UJ12_9BACI|nr:SPOR domain-containing protein [Rossellomorea aquimaris]TYS77807.1 SPOR domain-containing protein [Rossellomorea aquimaris]TYS86989.1 SPOR domain-containing protein [Rossellomorea aquimaris]
MMNNKRDEDKKISIKINGEKTNFNEDLLVYDWKLGETEAAAGEEAEDKGFDWILPDDEEAQPPKEYKKINYVSGNKKKRKSFKNPFQDSVNLLMSIIGAVVVGAVLGFGTLKVITTTDGPATPAATLQDTTAEANAEGKQSVSAVELQDFSTSILQGGVFSTEESLNAMKDSLAGKGLSSASVEKDGQFFLLLGVSGDLETAKSLGAELKEQGVDVFAKDFVFGAKGINASKEEKSFLEKGNGLYNTLAMESSSGMIGGTPDEKTIQTIQSGVKELEGIKVGQDSIASMKESLVNAGNLAAGMKTPDDAQKVQEELLSYLQHYSGL